MNKAIMFIFISFNFNAMNGAVILPQYTEQQSTASVLGAAFGTGLAKGLQNLANRLEQQKQKKEQAEKLQQAGLPEILAYMEPQVQVAYLREYSATQRAKSEQLRQQELHEFARQQAYQEQLKELAYQEQLRQQKLHELTQQQAYQEQLEELAHQEQLKQQELQELARQKKIIEDREQKKIFIIVLLSSILVVGFISTRFLKFK